MADHTATRRTLLAGTLSMSPTDTGNGVGKLKPQPFVFVKHVDKATPVLFLKCTTCQHVPQATLTARRRASRSPTSRSCSATSTSRAVARRRAPSTPSRSTWSASTSARS
jgi:hypothetical protein